MWYFDEYGFIQNAHKYIKYARIWLEKLFLVELRMLFVFDIVGLMKLSGCSE
jgi:hypothetical protein